MRSGEQLPRKAQDVHLDAHDGATGNCEELVPQASEPPIGANNRFSHALLDCLWGLDPKRLSAVSLVISYVVDYQAYVRVVVFIVKGFHQTVSMIRMWTHACIPLPCEVMPDSS